MTDWITQRQAAKLLGVGRQRVSDLVATGQLFSNGRASGGSLARDQVEELAAARARAAREAEEELARRLIARHDQRPRPPDDVHDWLTIGQAARLLGVTRQAVRARCIRGRMPHEWASGRRWVRRDLLELVERARAAQRSHNLT